MKKIGKKISYFTKVLLAFGLFFNSVSPLSIVFAAEIEDNKTDDNVGIVQGNDETLEEKDSQETSLEEDGGEEKNPVVSDDGTTTTEKSDSGDTQAVTENAQPKESGDADSQVVSNPEENNQSNGDGSNDDSSSKTGDGGSASNVGNGNGESTQSKENTGVSSQVEGTQGGDSSIAPEEEGNTTVPSEEKNDTDNTSNTQNNNGTLLDLYNVLKIVYSVDEYAFLIGNKDSLDVVADYYDSESDVTLEEYLDKILIDDETNVKIMNEGKLEYFASIKTYDDDTDKVTLEELEVSVQALIKNGNVGLDKADVNKDNESTVVDVMYLERIIKTNNGYLTINGNKLLDVQAKLALKDEGNIYKTTEFQVNYILSMDDYNVRGISGLVTYDEEMLALLSVTTKNGIVVSNDEGNFIFVSDGNVQDSEYLCVTFTFSAEKPGDTTILVQKPNYFDNSVYYQIGDDEVTTVSDVTGESTDAVSNNSTDENVEKDNQVLEKDMTISLDVKILEAATLSELSVGGQSIELQEGVYDYEVTVASDVTKALVDAVVSNENASITSIVSPEELVEGNNTVSIVVTDAYGDSRTYTITVVREKATTTEGNNKVEPMSYQENNYNYNDDNSDDNKSTIIDDDKEDNKKDKNKDVDKNEKNNLSRMIIVILILLVIAGLLYLIFRDEDDEETKKTNKDINKLKNDNSSFKDNNKKRVDNKRNQNKNNKKGR